MRLNSTEIIIVLDSNKPLTHRQMSTHEPLRPQYMPLFSIEVFQLRAALLNLSTIVDKP